MQFSSSDSQEFQDFLTVQDNSRSYQGLQEVTGISGKIQDLGKSFKIIYAGNLSGTFSTRLSKKLKNPILKIIFRINNE